MRDMQHFRLDAEIRRLQTELVGLCFVRTRFEKKFDKPLVADSGCDIESCIPMHVLYVDKVLYAKGRSRVGAHLISCDPLEDTCHVDASARRSPFDSSDKGDVMDDCAIRIVEGANRRREVLQQLRKCARLGVVGRQDGTYEGGLASVIATVYVCTKVDQLSND